jgi:hypothetical protein
MYAHRYQLLGFVGCGIALLLVAIYLNYEKKEPLLGEAQQGCFLPKILENSPLNFGSIVGSHQRERFISVDARTGAVSQSSFSHIGGRGNYDISRTHGRSISLGVLAFSFTDLKANSKLVVDLGLGVIDGLDIDGLSTKIESVSGMTLDNDLTTDSKIVFDVDSDTASASVVYGGQLTVASGVFGHKQVRNTVEFTWECS